MNTNSEFDINTMSLDTKTKKSSVKSKKIEFIIEDEEKGANLKERVDWAIKKPDSVVKKEGTTIAQQKNKLQNEEKQWGNDMIGQKDNGQWTTLLGENLVRDILELRGENPRKPEHKGGFNPDWETDEYIYEVKTSNWWVSGTAGEKV